MKRYKYTKMSENSRQHALRVAMHTYLTIFALSISIIGTVIAICKVSLHYYKQYKTFNAELAEAKEINNELDRLYREGERLEIVLVEKKDILNEKRIYDQYEKAVQRDVILRAHTKIAKQMVPVGTYIYLKSTCEAVRVSGHNGYECLTYEGIRFLATDTENYYMLSYREYYLKKNKDQLLKK